MVTEISIKNNETKQRLNYTRYNFEHKTVSFMSNEVRNEIDIMPIKGLCMKRYKGDIVLSNVDFSSKQCGDHFILGQAEFVITQIGKKCHSTDCVVYNEAKKCLMQKGVMFAEVVVGGFVGLNDEVEWKR